MAKPHGIYLPPPVRTAWADIPLAAKAVAGALATFMNRRGSCWPTIRTMGQAAGLKHRASVCRAIDHLESMGLLKVQRRGPRASIYTWAEVPPPGTGNEVPQGGTGSGADEVPAGDKRSSARCSKKFRQAEHRTISKNYTTSHLRETGQPRSINDTNSTDKNVPPAAPNPYAHLATLLRCEQLTEPEIRRVLAMNKRLNGDPVQVLGAVIQARAAGAKNRPAYAAELLRNHGVSDHHLHAAKLALNPESTQPAAQLALTLEGIGQAAAGPEPKKETTE